MQHWPAYTKPNERAYALRHVQVLEPALAICRRFRTAIQAGGSIGYWPLRLSQKFDQVMTFEPEPLIYGCMVRNLAHCKNIRTRRAALGEAPGRCHIERLSFGSHFVTDGDTTSMATVDELELDDVDFIQLDIEGYEPKALRGALKTLACSRPVLMVEILGKHEELFDFMSEHRYRLAKRIGRDYVFSPE